MSYSVVQCRQTIPDFAAFHWRLFTYAQCMRDSVLGLNICTLYRNVIFVKILFFFSCNFASCRQPVIFGASFSCPAFSCLAISCLAISCPANWSVIFTSCNFTACTFIRQFHVLQFHALQFWWSVIFMSVIFSQPIRPINSHIPCFLFFFAYEHR